MSPWTEEKVTELMDEAFGAPAGDPVHAKLAELLKQYPEYRNLWAEYQTLQRGLDLWSQGQSPSPMTRERILKASRSQGGSKVKVSSTWRWLLSQPVVAAATIVLVIGVGIYSQYGMKDQPLQRSAPPPPRSQSPVVDSESMGKDEGSKARQEAPAKKPASPSQEVLRKPAPQGHPVVPESDQKAGGPPPSRSRDSALDNFEAEAEPPAEGAAPAPLAAPGESRSLEEAKPPATEPTGGMGGLRKHDAPKLLQAPPSTQGVSGKKEAPLDKAKKQLESSKDSGVKKLIQEAKAKIQAGDCPGALKILKKAQGLEDSKEIRKLMAQCEPTAP